MASTAGKTVPDEAKLSALLLHKRVLTEGQLKAALDYQRSRGGRLFDVLVKLELIREQSLDQLLARLAQGDEEEAQAVAETDDSVLSTDDVIVAELKVHRRLLDKVPEDLVKQYLLALFFPSGNLSLRRIILGHGRPIPSDFPQKIGSLLGVDLYSLPLEPHDAVAFLQNCGRAELVSDLELESEEDGEDAQDAAEVEVEERRARGKQKEAKARTGSSKASRSRKKASSRSGSKKDDGSGGSSEVLLRALVSLLAKKGLISREEFEEELEEAGG